MRSLKIFIVLFIILLTTIVLAAPENDIDEDGILNNVDKCENTPKGAIIVNPIDNIDYAGCTCEQIKSLIDTENICVKFFCFEEVLDLELNTYRGNFTDCPDDECINYTYYDFPEDGYASCVNLELINHSCDPIITENSPFCGVNPNMTIFNIPFEIPEDKVFNEIPYPDNAKEYYLTDAVLFLSAPSEVLPGEEASIVAVMTFSGSGKKGVDVELFLKEQLIESNNVFCGEDVEGTIFCYSSWVLNTVIPGTKEYNMKINYSTSEGMITEQLDLPLEIKTIVDATLEKSSSLIGEFNFSVMEESLLELIYDQMKKKKLVDDYDLNDIKNNIEKVYEVSTISKDRKINPDSTTTYTLILEPDKRTTLYNVTIIEAIPKAVAERVDEINFSIKPTVIINEDPLIMWHFAAIDERIEISYKVNKPVQDSTGSVIVADSIEQKSIPWTTIALMIIIPVFILAIITTKLKKKGD